MFFSIPVPGLPLRGHWPLSRTIPILRTFGYGCNLRHLELRLKQRRGLITNTLMATKSSDLSFHISLSLLYIYSTIYSWISMYRLPTELRFVIVHHGLLMPLKNVTFVSMSVSWPAASSSNTLLVNSIVQREMYLRCQIFLWREKIWH